MRRVNVRKRGKVYQYQFEIGTTENYYITSTTNDLIKISESVEKEIDINMVDKF